MKSQRRAITFAAAATTLVTALALQGCAAGTGATDTEVTKLTIWGAQSTSQVTQDLLQEYGEANDIEMDFVTIPDGFEANVLTKWTTGERPDILLGQPGGFLLQLNPKENLQDLSDMDFVEQTKFDLGREAGAVDGVSYTATTGFPTVFGLLYNKAVFADNGLEPPTTPAEYQEVMQTLKANGVTPMFLAGGDTWTLQLPYFTNLADALVDGLIQDINSGDAEWTNPAVIDAYDSVKALVDDEFVNPDWKTATFSDQAAALESGTAAMVLQGSWILPSITDTSKVGFVAYPSKSAKSMWQTSNLSSVQLPKTGNEAQEAAARAYVDWATVGEGYKKYLETAKEPSIIQGVDDPADLSEIQLDLAYAFNSGGVPSVDMQALVGPGDLASLLSQYLLGTITAQDATKQMQVSFVQNAKTAGLPGF